jgi:hypothetical protein
VRRSYDDATDVVNPIQSPTLSVAAAMAMLDSPTRARVEAPAPDTEVAARAHAAEKVRESPTMDLSGQFDTMWPPGSIFAPGFLHADRRGLVAWPGLDVELARFLAYRSVQPTDLILQQARQSYNAISALEPGTGSGSGTRGSGPN